MAALSEDSKLTFMVAKARGNATLSTLVWLLDTGQVLCDFFFSFSLNWILMIWCMDDS
jgi:hypothetical protein